MIMNCFVLIALFLEALGAFFMVRRFSRVDVVSLMLAIGSSFLPVGNYTQRIARAAKGRGEDDADLLRGFSFLFLGFAIQFVITTIRIFDDAFAA